MVDTKSERGKDHDCIVALSTRMEEYINEKDAMISHLMFDLRKKDDAIRELVSKFSFLERKLLRNNDIA
jgi:hypothetical protein